MSSLKKQLMKMEIPKERMTGFIQFEEQQKHYH